MNKPAIKNCAVSARRKLLEGVKAKMLQAGISEEGMLTNDEAAAKLLAIGVILSSQMLDARKNLCQHIAKISKEEGMKAALEGVAEEAAYTWFNRLAAIRFMEANSCLPSGIRILSSESGGLAEPDAIRYAEILPYTEKEEVAQLRKLKGAFAQEKLFRYILISQVNDLSAILPGLFEKIGGVAELLLPDLLISKGGAARELVDGIDEADFREGVQIIGWLYQYYISEKKDEVFKRLKGKSKIEKASIPAATQLFTPEWIARYIVENSVGRLWLHSHRDCGLKRGFKYFLDVGGLSDEKPEACICPEQIKILDPCMGSGHILVCAFDALARIYESAGYAKRDIPNLILEHNLYGLDIDKRASQLAYFSLMMKARLENRRFFLQENPPQPHVSCFSEPEISASDFERLPGDLKYICALFENSMEIGSLLKAREDLRFEEIRLRLGEWPNLKEAVDAAQILCGKYSVVCTNPPYMGSSGMEEALSSYIMTHYPNSKNDLFAAFIERCLEMAQDGGFISMVTQHAWMFLSSYELLRKKLFGFEMVCMAHLGARAFPDIGGEVVQSTAFTMRKAPAGRRKGVYMRLVDYDNAASKERSFLEAAEKCGRGEIAANIFQTDFEKFLHIPGNPVAYWATEKAVRLFSEGSALSEMAEPRQGLATGDNSRFVRLWHEVDFKKCGFGLSSRLEALESGKKWFPYNKGGEYRKWYGNNSHLVDWEGDGKEIRNFADDNGKLRSRPQNMQYYFRESITWSFVSSSYFGARLSPTGALFDVGGSSVFPPENLTMYLLAFLCSKISLECMKMQNPTMNFQVGNVGAIPVIVDDAIRSEVDSLASECVGIAKTEWDSYETSVDFKKHPLVRGKELIKDSFEEWRSFTQTQFLKMKENESRLNCVFLGSCGMEGEIDPISSDKDVTLRKADIDADLRSLLSYAVGCAFGRYSLDEDGLVCAGTGFEPGRYKSFHPKEDNIIPITPAGFFEDDIISRVAEFLSAAFGKDSLSENLEFIADAISGGCGSAAERLRRYFSAEFFRDHLRAYRKLPVYWLVESGAKGAFKALIYLQRYDRYTMARVRTDYLHPIQRKYESEASRLKALSYTCESASEKAALKKEMEGLQAKALECAAWDQALNHVAGMEVELDLDDGVKANYAKLQSAQMPASSGMVEKVDLLAKI
ncbi:MAG: BREX-1 system adenine-specific DNA-methyltransferase PglX [Clostridiales bacterium]|jgi:hypothetical protein|nr:BREX-1 system adenine-specific DNA-methyltransferase PglX [Clostridiales bacterium]